jgi:hypothetical protein
VITLIRRRFLSEWPLVAIGVPCAADGPATPSDGGSFARLQVWCDRTGQLGWIILGMWTPAALQQTAREMLMDAARHVFDDVTIPSDDGTIVIDRGIESMGSLDGEHWMFAMQFSFRLA